MKLNHRWTAIAMTVGALALTGCSSDETLPETVPATSEAAPAPTQTPTATPTPTPVDDPRVFGIGEPVTLAGSTLVVNSFEVLHEIPTVDGEPLVAAAGEQFVLFHTHYVNGSTQTADLSCSGAPDWYVQVLDTEQRELAAAFDTYRIPGNPECNHQLLSGQEADWSFAFRGTDGATPMVLQITDSRTFEDFVAVDLTGTGLTITEG
jgi:hypothetical protein